MSFLCPLPVMVDFNHHLDRIENNLGDKPLSMCVQFLDWVHWGGKTHSSCGQHPPAWVQELNEKENVNITSTPYSLPSLCYNCRCSVTSCPTLLLNPGLPNSLGWLLREPRGSSWPCLPCAEVTGVSCYICPPLARGCWRNWTQFTMLAQQALYQLGKYTLSSSLQIKQMEGQRANAPLYITCCFVVLMQCLVPQLQECGWQTCLE